MCIAQRNPYFLTWGQILHGWATTIERDSVGGIAEIEEGIAGYRDTDSLTWLPCFLGLHAEACLRANRPDDGLALVSEALVLVEMTGERAWLAELNRLKGELLLAMAPADLAAPEQCLSQALDIAREQEAKSWEVRACASLCRLYSDHSKKTPVYQHLRSCYERFTEGFDTSDLREAKALIDGIDAT